MYVNEQDEATRPSGEGLLDRTTQATGQHYSDGFYGQDEATMSEGERAEETERAQEKLCLRGGRNRVRVRVRRSLRV